MDLRRLCEACEAGTDGVEKIDDSVSMDEVGENVRSGGGVQVSRFKSGSKGELDGEAKGASLLIGKVKARGVGEMIATVGGSGASVVTSRSVGEREAQHIMVSTMYGMTIVIERQLNSRLEGVSRVRYAGMIVL